MSELKTLKDMDLRTCKDCGANYSCGEIRNEAIAWIKENNDTELEDTCKTSDTYGVKNWIKHFFNITESDLNG
jgi:hypothetical protein